MKNLERFLVVFSLFSFSLFLCPGSLLAYIDPGTGSYLIQLIIAAFIGATVAVRLFWSKIKNFLIKIFKKQ